MVTANGTDHSIARIGFEENDDVPLVPVLTLVGWVVCLAIGLLGFMLPYSRPLRTAKAAESVKVQRLVVELSKEPTPPMETDRQSGNPQSIAPLPADAMAPPPIPVAQPSPAIAFAVPVEGPTRVFPLDQATYAPPVHSAQSSAVQHLTFGQGEGRQPSPDYPAEALQQHQEGTVVVRLVVADSGQVSSAEAIQPCRWSLLNEAAVRAVRQRWRFSTGSMRVYDVAIRFQIATQ
jgi:periplasmic protein TonB